jgi:hydrogenase/urease accessory protein HupE
MNRSDARIARLLLLLFWVCQPVQLPAHELQPASLELRQLVPERYELIWRAPIYYGKPHPAAVQLPDSWERLGEPTVRQLPDSSLQRQLLLVPDGTIDGETIRFPGLEATITDVFTQVTWLDGARVTALVRPEQPWLEIDGQRSAWQVSGDYIMLGIDHILSGFDHLLFVLALMLIVSGWQRLLITVTAFTLAHSVTLAAATLGLVSVPGPPVEATIALSILFLASELVRVNRGEASMTARNPWVVALAFGLLHGFGFAGALAETGLPQNDIPLALLMFNIGVELGQLLFIAAVVTIVLLLRRLRSEWPVWARLAPAYCIGGMAAFWLIERVNGF